MDFILNAVKAVFSLSGASALFVGVFLVALLMARLKPMAAFKSAVYCGSGVIGLNAMIGMFASAVMPVLTAAIEKWNLKFSMVDMGTGSATAIAYADAHYVWYLLLIMLFNLACIFLKLTNTFTIDLINFSCYAIAGTMVYGLTGNFIFSVIAVWILEFVCLKVADHSAPAMAQGYGLEGVSIPHPNAAVFAPVGILVNSVIEKIPPLAKIDLSPDSIQRKFNGVADPCMIGFVMGIVLGVLGGLPMGQLLTFAITITAFMLIFPKCTGLLVDGLLPMAEGMQKFCERTVKRPIYIGLDCAILIGMPDVISTGMLLIPITILLAIILPGNKFLPLADLAIAPPFLITCVMVHCKKNVFRGLVAGTIIMIISLYVCTFSAPIYTQLATQLGVPFAEGAVGTSFGIGSNPIPFAIYKFFELFY